jgi:DNA (cytosine-5)-methyltransferase 1
MKPAYVVPSMSDIAKVQATNGFNTVSLFAGCGGSCLGFKMAGYKPLYASEFIAEAQTTYRLNNPNVFLDTRDIREVTATSILEKIGTDTIDVLEGSPPCSSFSSAGKGSAGWGEAKLYSDGKHQRTDDLFFEFARLLRDLQPKVFVAENVKGLVQGDSKGYFKIIFRALTECGYRVEAKLLNASRLGVPQSRQRIIFIGVRNDLDCSPVFPKPFPYTYSISEAITNNPEMTDPETGEEISIEPYAIHKVWQKLRQGESPTGSYFSLVKPSPNKPIPTITATSGSVGAASVTHHLYPRKYNLQELRQLSGFPHDFLLTGSYQQRVERIGRAVPPLMMKAIAETICEKILTR